MPPDSNSVPLDLCFTDCCLVLPPVKYVKMTAPYIFHLSSYFIWVSKSSYYYHMCVSARSVAHSCWTLCDPMNCSPPDFFVPEISQASILEWVAISFSRGSSWPRDWTMSPVSPALQADSLPLNHPRSPYYNVIGKSQCSFYIPIVINNFILVSFLLSYLKSVLKCFCFAQWFLHYFIRRNNKLYYIMY